MSKPSNIENLKENAKNFLTLANSYLKPIKDFFKEDGKEIYEFGKILFHALILATLAKTLFFQPFNIPSGSMKETLLIGDYLFVSKTSYGYSKYSLPFSPNLFNGRIFGAKPKRGDIIVFRLPRDTNVDYIKRLIGFPGDTIQVRNGVVFLNGKAIPKKRIDDLIIKDKWGLEKTRIARYQETLPNGVKYEVLDETPYGDLDNTRLYTVPAGHYFMMGDNRDNSADSRVTKEVSFEAYGNERQAVGYIPEENLIGRASMLFFSATQNNRWWAFWRWPFEIRWSRFFKSLRV